MKEYRHKVTEKREEKGIQRKREEMKERKKERYQCKERKNEGERGEMKILVMERRGKKADDKEE